ncbi:hypothetical protein NITGR_730052 [Nitrospina gracilis 3/211]|uniref:Uncharacterized protein n=1 Tax=Nitrospina gracilis (strain 3/211) TaxID=1266370 RepID=M1Z0U5_NITG3|nr:MULTISPECIES: hypothetical protein [Nitrospina]MCF8724436.1 Na+-transporting methylmalonyl-CoA/oxaloacetate decarboxylase gamma subunit [Nitrospina sp. Nb-3]CCQ91594.1 hypothetical protein NITGR_730052 [Nitrospina gracilis 3/211]
MSNSVFLVIVVGIVLAMLVLMVRYARFIHNYPSQTEDESVDQPQVKTKPPETPEDTK